MPPMSVVCWSKGTKIYLWTAVSVCLSSSLYCMLGKVFTTRHELCCILSCFSSFKSQTSSPEDLSCCVCVCTQGRKVHYKRQNNHTGTRRGSEVWPITILSCGRINITIIIIMELKWDFTFPNRLLWGFTFHNHRSRKTYINLSWRRRDGLFGEATTAEKVFLGTTGRRFYSNTHYGCTMKSNWLSRKAK